MSAVRGKRMKRLKNILIVISLLVAAMPCTHADEHPDAARAGGAEVGVSCHCSCHSCEDTVCTDDLEVRQMTASVPSFAVYPASEFILLVLTEEKPMVRTITTVVYDPLIALQTVQLLI